MAIQSRCKNPVNSEKQCKIASTFFSKAIFVNAMGDGHDLPYGCVWDKMVLSSSVGVIFWNPKGVTMSLDWNIAQVCFEPTKSFEGKF